MTPREVLALCREKDVKAVDLRFTDLFGAWHHQTIPVGKLEEAVFEDGVGFDASSFRGWQAVHESDMLLVPQPDTAFLDPFAAVPTLALVCSVQDPVTGEPYVRDPRHIAAKAANYLRHTGIADIAFFAAESQFFVFDKARFRSTAHEAFYRLKGPAAHELSELSNEMMQAMLDAGLEVEAHHHEAGCDGLCEINLRYQPLVKMADWVQVYKYCVRNVARRHNKAATFMPQPRSGGRGSAMHTHFSFWREGEPLFAGSGYAGLSEAAEYAVGGILHHAPALLALCCPTTNSFKRLVPGSEAPVHLVYSQRNRSAACRIPVYSQSPKARRIEFRCPDPACNPYLAFAAITMAAIDGIQIKLSPGQPVDEDLYRLSCQELAEIGKTPATLDEALAALERDSEFLLRDEVFTPDVLQTWIEHKQRSEVEAIRSRPHPHEFCLYFDA